MRYNVRMFLARKERPRLHAYKNPPSKRVVARQPNLLITAPDTSPEKLMSAVVSEPTQAEKETMYKKKSYSQKEFVVNLIPRDRAVHIMFAQQGGKRTECFASHRSKSLY